MLRDDTTAKSRIQEGLTLVAEATLQHIRGCIDEKRYDRCLKQTITFMHGKERFWQKLLSFFGRVKTVAFRRRLQHQMGMEPYRHGSHSVFSTHVRSGWITKYRKVPFTGELAVRGIQGHLSFSVRRRREMRQSPVLSLVPQVLFLRGSVFGCDPESTRAEKRRQA